MPKIISSNIQKIKLKPIEFVQTIDNFIDQNRFHKSTSTQLLNYQNFVNTVYPESENNDKKSNDQFRKFINFKCWYYFILEEFNLDVKSNGNFEAIVEILPDCSKEEEFKYFTGENMKLIFTFEGAVDIEYKILEYLIKNHK